VRDAAVPWLPRRRQNFAVTNPTSGTILAASIVAPTIEGRWPLLVLVPGGVSAGNLSFGVSGIAERYARRGYAAVFFDPDGRGASAGVEDYGGPTHQDGLAAVLAAAVELPGVDASRVTLVSFSSGGVMAAGALARYPVLPVSLYVDWEGPALRQHHVRILAAKAEPAQGQPAPSTDDAWWEEREAAPYLQRVTVPYQRVQSTPDHAQGHLNHARLMLHSATSEAYGGLGRSPWTRLNGNEPNQLFESGFEPHWLPTLPAEVAVYAYLAELVPAA
jgi:pimeloyl-ACP methyl ester carboxylesterase